MASLIRPLIAASKQTSGFLSVMQRRLESTKPPFPTSAVEGSLNKPLEHAEVDPLADPKESCKFRISRLLKFIDFLLIYELKK